MIPPPGLDTGAYRCWRSFTSHCRWQFFEELFFRACSAASSGNGWIAAIPYISFPRLCSPRSTASAAHQGGLCVCHGIAFATITS